VLLQILQHNKDRKCIVDDKFFNEKLMLKRHVGIKVKGLKHPFTSTKIASIH